jgi:WD40 repeat protein
MSYEKIRTISTSYSGDRFAVAEFEKRVQIWDLHSGLLRVFDTDFDFGGKRLSISNSGKYLAIGSYNKNTITTYSLDTGEILWTRKDLKKCGTIKLIGNENELIFVTLEKQASQLLSADNGETIRKINGGQELWKNHEGLYIVEKADKITLAHNDLKSIENIPKTTFAILDSCFTEDTFITSYSGGPLECLDLVTLKQRWATKPVGHFLNVGYNTENNKVISIRWEYEKGSPKYLTILNDKTGNIEKEFDLGNIIEHSFIERNNLLLTSTGKLISTFDGRIIKEFDFENS